MRSPRNYRNCSFWSAACRATIFSGLALAAHASAADPPTLAQIKKVWKERESRTTSFTVKWKEVTKDSRSIAVDPFAEELPGAGFSTHTYERTLKVQGSHIRLDDGAPNWYPERGSYEYGRTVYADNGKAASVLFRGEDDGGAPLRITRQTGGRVATRLRSWIDLHPILDHYRPSWNLQELCELGTCEIQNGEVDGRACAVVKIDIKFDMELHTIKIWLEPGDYSVRRITRHSNEVKVADFSRTYSPHPDMGVILTGWTITRYWTTGAPKRDLKASVIDTATNEKIDDAEFVIDVNPP